MRNCFFKKVSLASLIFTLALAFPDGLFSQDKKSSIFDSTELSDQAPKNEVSPGKEEIEGLFSSADRSGEAIKIGLNYFPKEFSEIAFVSAALLEQIEDRPELSSCSPRLLLLNQTLGIDCSRCKWMVRGWVEFESLTRYDSTGLGTPPNLLVIKGNGAFDDSKISSKKQESGGVSYYRSGNGVAFGFPTPDTLVAGTTNEVLNALRMGKDKTNDRQPGWEWLDYESFDSVKLERAGTDYDISAAFFTKGKTSGRIMLFQNSGLAKIHAKRMQLYNDFLVSDDPASFLATHEEEMLTHGALAMKPNDEQRQGLIAAARNHKQNLSAAVSFEQDGPRLVISETFDVDSYHGGGQILDRVLPEVENSRNFSTENAKDRLATFETYNFAHRDGTDAEDALIQVSRTFSSSQGDIYSDLPTESTTVIEFLLNNTSSRVFRSELIDKLARVSTPQSVMILGKEAHRFDLSDAQTIRDSKEDDRPLLLGRESFIYRTRDIDYSALVNVLKYYLANPGDPVLLTAVCKIAGDLKFAELEGLIRNLAESGTTDVLKQAAQSALESIEDTALVPKNVLQSPEDASVALGWLKGTEREKKAAALVWVMRNPELGEQHSRFVDALIVLLDDGLYYEEALTVLKKICKPEDAPQFRNVLKMAADPDNRQFKMRQKYSVTRIAEMAFHLRDQEGIKLAYQVGDFDVGQFIKEYSEQNDVGVAKLTDNSLVDFVNEFITKPDRIHLPRLSRMELPLDQKRKLLDWAKDEWKKKGKITEEIRFWLLVENCEPFEIQDIPLLIEKIFSSSGFHSNTIRFLSSQGSEIEPLVHSEIDAGKKVGSEWDLVELLAAVGSEKSVSYLQRLKSEKGDEIALRLNKQIDDAIETVKRRK